MPKKPSRYVDPQAPLDNNNLPISSYGSVDANSIPNFSKHYSEQPVHISDTGSASYVGDQFERNSLDDQNVYQEDLPQLEDERASNQGTIGALGDAFAKFAGKTVLSTIGNIAGTIYGVGAAIGEGKLSDIWDNSFMDAVDAGNKKLDNIFQVYRNSDYQEQNILQRAFLHPTQFIDEATDTASFMAGAVLSEIATSGLGSETIVPRALKYMKYLSEGAEAAEATKNLTSFGTKAITTLGDFGTTVKHLAMGASYEGIVEARQATMQLRDKMYQDYSKDHPNEAIPESVKEDIDKRLSDAGLFTYLGNLALVGGTNLLLFPKLFGLGHETAKIAEGSIVKDTETGLFKAAKEERSFTDNLITGLTKPFEESTKFGVQGTISNTAREFWDRKHDEGAKQDVNGLLATFGKQLADTYTSKEGWNNIGMGMIIGALGAPGRGILSPLGEKSPLGKYGYKDILDENGVKIGSEKLPLWTGGVKGSFDERREQEHRIGKVLNNLNEHTDFFKAAQANYNTLVENRSLQVDQDKALDNGDIFNFQNAKDDQIHSYVSSRIKNNLYQDLLDEVNHIKRLSPDEFYKNFKGDEAADKAIDMEKLKFQLDTASQFLEKAENTKKAISIADNVYRGDNDDLRDHLVHSIAASKNLDLRERLMNQSLADLSGGLISNLSLAGTSTDTIGDRIKQNESLLKSNSLSAEEKEELSQHQEQLKQVSNLDLTPDEHNAMVNLAKSNPTAFALNKDKIEQLLQDSRKLRSKRQDYLDVYNHLYTQEGQKQFEDTQKKIQETILKSQQEDQKIQEDKVAEKQKKDNIKETLKKADIPNVEEEGDHIDFLNGDYSKEIEEDQKASGVIKEDSGSTKPTSTIDSTVEEKKSYEEPINISKELIENFSKIATPSPSTLEEKLKELGKFIKDDLNQDITYIYSSKENNRIELTIGNKTIYLPEGANFRIMGGGNIYASFTLEDLLNTIYNQKNILSPEETAVVRIEQSKEIQSNRGLITQDIGLIVNQPEEHYKQIGNDVKLINLDKLRTVGNTIAYVGVDNITLARLKDGNIEVKTYDIFDENDNIQINKFVDVKLFSQNHYTIGDSLELFVPTFEEMEQRGLEKYTNSDYSSKIDDIEEFPIAIRNKEGVIIGYLPAQTSIKRLVAPEFRDRALAENIALRQTIDQNRDKIHTTNITDKSPGFIIADKYENQKSLFKSLGDGKKLANNVKLGIIRTIKGTDIITAKDLYTDDSGIPFKDGEIVNEKAMKNGVIYSIVPSSSKGKYIVYPMKTNKIGINNARTVVEAIKIFALGNNIGEQEKESLKNIKEFNFKNFNDLNEFVNRIMYGSSRSDASDNTIFKLYKDSLYLSSLKDQKFRLEDIATSQEIRNQIADILSDRYYSVRVKDLNTSNPYISYHLDEDKGVIQEKENESYQHYLNDNEVITSNVRGVHIENNDYAFTAQPVISLSNTIQKETKQLTQGKEEVKPMAPRDTVEYDKDSIKNSLYSFNFNDAYFKSSPIGTIVQRSIHEYHVDEYIKASDNSIKVRSVTRDISKQELSNKIDNINRILKGNKNILDDLIKSGLSEYTLDSFIESPDDINIEQLNNSLISYKSTITSDSQLDIISKLLDDLKKAKYYLNKKDNREDDVVVKQAPSSKLSKKKLNIDINKLKNKPLEDINPEFIEKSNIKSGDDLRNKCL